MTRIGILISALILVVFASPSHALTFHYSFGGVEGLISGLEDNSTFQPADSVTVTASPIGGLGEYAPGFTNQFTVFNGVMFSVDFLSFNLGNTFILDSGTGFLVVSGNETLDVISYSPVADTRVPAPIVGAGLPGILVAGAGLLAWWRRKRRIECRT